MGIKGEAGPASIGIGNLRTQPREGIVKIPPQITLTTNNISSTVDYLESLIQQVFRIGDRLGVNNPPDKIVPATKPIQSTQPTLVLVLEEISSRLREQCSTLEELLQRINELI